MESIHDQFVALYTAFNARDTGAVLAVMDPDVDWPNGMEGGRVHGHEAVTSYWTRQWGMIDPHVEPVAIHDDGAGCVTVDVHQTVRDMRGTLLADHVVQHVYSMRDGLVTHMEIRQAAG